MTNKIPIKAGFTNGNATSLAEFEAGDTIPVANGGTGSTGGDAAKINLTVITAADGSLVVPSGNTSARDASPSSGFIRFNSELSQFEGYNGTEWGPLGADENTDQDINSLGVGTTATGVSGEIVAVGDITANASDDRLKTRLGKIENSVDKVESLNGFYFEFNETGIDLGLQEGRRVGVSAQEVQTILPEVVRQSPVSDEYLTVQYEKLVPLLVEAIKELKQEINDLKKKI